MQVREKSGNGIVFDPIIQVLNLLRTEGLTFEIKGRSYKVYFVTSLILGDNAGLNAISGYTTSFTSSCYCRICYVNGTDAKNMTREGPTILRTIHKYNQDVGMKDVHATGVKESRP